MDIDMLLIFEKGIRGGITQAVKRYAKANNRYMKDLNNLDEKSIQNLPIHRFKWKNGEDFTPEKIDKLVKKDKRGDLLEVDVEYPKGLPKNHNELPFLVERMKIRREEKLVPNLKDKKRYVAHIKALDQALKHGLKLRKVHQVIPSQQSGWMKAYIMLNTKLSKDAKNEFEKDFFKLMNNSVSGKTMENIRNHKNMKLVTSDK